MTGIAMQRRAEGGAAHPGPRPPGWLAEDSLVGDYARGFRPSAAPAARIEPGAEAMPVGPVRLDGRCIGSAFQPAWYRRRRLAVGEVLQIVGARAVGVGLDVRGGEA